MTPHKDLYGFSSFNDVPPGSSQWRWEKLSNTKQSKCRGTRHGQETHSSHEHVLRRTTIPTGLLLCRPRTGWRSNQSPCLRGTRSWGKRSSMRDVCTHTSKTQVKGKWAGTAAGQGQKEEPHQKQDSDLEAPRRLLENVKAGGSFNWNKTFWLSQGYQAMC